VIAKDDEFKALMHEDAEFTTVGFNAGIRQMADTLTSYQDSRLAYINAGKELKASLDKAYELYNSLFVLMMELTHEQYTRLENAKTKHLATPEELNPNMRFAENMFIERLRENESLQNYLSANPVSWENNPALIRSLLDSILSSQLYAD